jgi:hypothetical protein
MAGARSLRAIAAGLNARGIRTPRAVGEWRAETVSQLLGRMPVQSSAGAARDDFLRCIEADESVVIPW